MRPRFFVAIGAALVGALGLHCALLYAQLGAPTRSTVWAYEINQKKLQRAASIDQPKLIVMGGSATLFGIQAELIEETLGYPTVNMGTHAGLGIGYMLHLVKPAARPGDTVLLAFEYGIHKYGTVRADPIFVDYVLARDPAYFLDLPLAAQFQIAMMTPVSRLRQGLENRFKPPKPPRLDRIYHASRLNAHGDQLGNDAPARRTGHPVDMSLASDWFRGMPAVENLREFVSWARANQVRVLATYPNLLDHPSYHTALAERARRRLQDAYAGLNVPMIGTIEESLMPASAFFDTLYHLTREGARQRTQRLIPHLAEALSLGPVSSPLPNSAPPSARRE